MIKEYGYEYDAVLDEQLWKATYGRVATERFFGARCLRSGRDALRAIAREYEPTEVFLSALSCDSMIQPFKQYNHKVRFYQLNTDYSINITSLQNQIDPNKPVLFLYMDYFGNQAITDTALNSLKYAFPKMIFIEDRTHNLLNKPFRNFQPDYVMASLRKWCNIPDGGLLWDNKKLQNEVFSSNLEFAEKRLKAQCMRHEFFISEDSALKIKYRKIFSTVSDIIDDDPLPGRMSLYSYEIAKKTDFDSIMLQRRQNAETLLGELRQRGMSFVQNESGVSDLYVPIIVDGRDELQKKLASDGIFCTVIWPLSEIQKKACKVAEYTEKHILAVYCDQRMTEDDMEYIASMIVRNSNV